MAVVLISIAVAVHQAWATNIFTTASDMFPKEAVSSVVGIGGMAGAVGGILFPILVGRLLDTYKAAGNVQAVTICCLLFADLPTLSPGPSFICSPVRWKKYSLVNYCNIKP
jgi:nitrate/nitrite transporter NarK